MHSPVDVYFVSASYDRTARLWATDLIYPLRIFAGHTAAVDVCTTKVQYTRITTENHKLWSSLLVVCTIIIILFRLCGFILMGDT